MVIKPRKVAPGWFWRWPKEAFQLMSRAWILWMGTAAILAAICQCLPPVLRVFIWPVGGFLFTLSTGLAEVSDRKYVTAEDLMRTLVRASRIVRDDLYDQRMRILLAFAIYFYTFLRVQGVSWGQSNWVGPDDLVPWLFSFRSPLSSTGFAMWSGVMLQASGIRLPGLGSCLKQTFGDMDRDQVFNLTVQAASANRTAVIGVQAFVAVIALFLLVCPLVSWAFGVFLPVLSYVAFREMFVDSNGNRKRAARTAANRATHTAASSA